MQCKSLLDKKKFNLILPGEGGGGEGLSNEIRDVINQSKFINVGW